MKKTLFLIVILCFSVLLFSQQTCTEPTSLSLIEATSSTVKFSWDVASQPSNTRSNLELWNEADLVNFAGRGNNGSDVSALYGGGITLGQEAKSPSQKVADDFTLDAAAFVTQMDFYAFQPESGTNSSTITGVYIEIYDVCPIDTTIYPIWNGSGSNLLSASYFSGIYRTTASGFSETSCPIMKVTANINTSLAAGTYWVSVSLTGNISLAAPCITPRVVPNQTRTGNAMVLDLQNSIRWQEWKMGGSLENIGMPFTVKGYTNDSIVGFNVYRDNTLVSSNYGRFNYTDQGLAQATTYTYQVEALYQNGCISSRSTSTSFSTLADPCIITEIPYTQQFSTPGVGFIPTCWSIATTGTDPYHSTQEYTTAPSSMLLPAITGTNTMAIMPPVSSTIPMTGLQLVFYARKSDASAKLSVAKVLDMTAPLINKIDVVGVTPSQVDVWEKFTINLSGIAEDNNRNLAFVATDGNVYIDDLTLRIIPTCPSPEALSIQNITPTSADITWTAGGLETMWALDYRESSESNWNYAGDLIDTTYTLSNLAPAGTYTYEIRVRAKCSDTDQSDWIEGEFSFQTLCGVISTYPYTEDFEAYTPTAYATAGENPLCWTSSNTVSYAAPHVTSEKVHSGSNAYSMSTKAGYAYAVLPEFSVPLASLFLRFSLHQSNISGTNTSLGYLTEANDVSTFVPITTHTNTSISAYTEYSIFLNAYNIPDTAERLAFRWYSRTTWLEFHCNIDDLSIDFLPTCLFPFAPTVDSITQTTARIGIHPRGNETAWDIAYRNEYDEDYTVVRVTDTFHTITGLVPGEYHDVKIRTVCSTDNISDWSNAVTLHTMCSEITELPYRESFDSYGTGSEIFPHCMMATGSGTMYVNSDGQTNYCLYFTNGKTALFPVLSAEIPVTSLQVSFYAKKLSSANNIEIGVMSDPTDGNTFVPIHNLALTTGYQLFELSLATSTASNMHRHIAFRSTSGYIYVDEFEINYIQPCSRVSGDSISVSNMTDTSAVISWNYDANNQYTLKWRGGDEDEYSYIDTITSPYTLTGLDGNRIYSFHIQISCDGLMVDYIESEEKRFQTSCSTIKQFPYSENFNYHGNGAGVLPSCWHSIGNGTYPYISSNTGMYAGTVYLYSPLSGTSYLITPEIDSTIELNGLTFSFDMEASVGNGITVGLMSDPANAATFRSLGEVLPSTPGSFETFSFNIENAPLTHRYIAFMSAIGTTTGTNSTYFDNFKLEYHSDCLPPTTFGLSNIGSDFATFTWEIDEYSNWDIAFRKSGTDRWEEFYENYDGSITFSSLSTGTDYEVRIRTNCNSTVLGNWSEPFTFTTLCEGEELPYAQNFNRYSIGEVPDCFTVVTKDNTATSDVARTAFYLNASPTSPAQASLPMINRPINEMKMTFRYQSVGNNQQLYVGIMSNPYDISTFEVCRVLTQTMASTWEDVEIYFNGYTGDGGMITFISDATADYRSNQIYLDDIRVEALDGCIKPVSLSAERPTSTSFYLNWAGTETVDYWELYFAAPGENINAVEPISIDTKPYQITSLSPSTTYQMKLKTYCTDGETSEISNLFTYTTLCAAITELPYSEPFDTYGVGSAILPDCWSSVTDQLVKAHTVYGDFSTPGALSLSANARGYQIAVLPEMGIALSNTQLTFIMKTGNTSANLEVGVMTDPYDAETFELFQTVTPFSTEWNTFNVPLNSYSGTGTFIAFRVGGNIATSFLIDNVVVDEAADCVPPVSLSVSNLTENSVRLIWPASSGTTWEVVYGIHGFNPNTDATPVTTIDNYLNVSELNMGIPYEFYVRTVCGDETSEWSLPFNFSVLCDDITLLPYANSFDLFGTGEGSFPLCWASHNSSGVVGNPYLSATHSSAPASLCLTGGTTYFVMASAPRISEAYLMNLSISFKMRVTSASNALSVGISTTPDDPNTFTQLENITLDVANTWIDTTIYIFNNSEAKRFVTFKVGNSDATVFIDDLVIDTLPDCFSPRSHTFSTSYISHYSAVVNWEITSSDTWDIMYGLEGFNPNDTTGITHRVTNSFDTLTNLLGNTIYWYYVRSVCEDEIGEWSLRGSFRTLCDQPLSLPFTEDFDSYTIDATTHNQAGIMPLCWFAHSSGSYVAPHIINSGNTFYYSSAPNALSLSALSTFSAAYAVFPAFNRSLNGYTLSFYFRQESNEGVLNVGYVTDPGNMSTYTNLQTFAIETAGRIDSVLLGDYTIPNSAHLAFRWDNTNTLVHSVCVDDISIHPTFVPPCLAPTSFTVENTTHNTAQISWISGNNEVNWTVKYRPEGATTFATVNAVNNPQLTLSSLLSDTTYYVEVRSDCGNGLTSDSLAGTFRTEAEPVVIYYTIEASAGNNGSIRPEGNVQVVENGYQPFEFIPDTGYKVKSVVVNGTQVGTEILAYNFGPVIAHGTIHVEFIETSISDYEKNNLITIYPNPTTGEVRIEKLGDFEIEGIKIFDVYGKNIDLSPHQSINPSTFTIDISHLPAGVYFFKIATDEGVMVKKIVRS